MPNKRPATLALLLAVLTSIGATGVCAQDGERWYQVELMVISQPDYQGHQSEQWPAEPELGYPATGRFLIDPLQLSDSRDESIIPPFVFDEFGRMITTLPAAHDPEADPVATGPALPPLATVETVDSGAGIDPLIAAAVNEFDMLTTVAPAAEDDAAPLRPTPFVTLPAALREFEGKAAYMRRRGGYGILFHQAWRQPVRGPATAIPIVLDRSGDSGNWPLLQGSIRLHLTRYLHLETNLWLNTRGAYLPAEWRMPPPPLGPASRIVEQLPAPWLENPALDIAADPDMDGTAQLPDPATSSDKPTHEDLPGEPGTEAIEEPVSGMVRELAAVYPYRHAVLLQAKRRMRSKEVHYIDHPMLGIVVRLTPLSAQDLEALALAEAAAGAAQSQ